MDGGETFAVEAWKIAFNHVHGLMNWGEEMTRDFLDSIHGRQYADVMHDKLEWVKALDKEWGLEQMCRAFFEETDLPGYRKWCNMNGTTPTERTLAYSGFSKEELRTAVNYLLDVEYPQEMINAYIEKAGPIAQAFVKILEDIPEEIVDLYVKGGLPEENSDGMSPS